MCSSNRIPVLGHADGICHMYVDEHASMSTAVNLCVDAKTDYPAACNAVETILLHNATLDNHVADGVLRALRSAGVTVLGGPNAVNAGLVSPEHAAESFTVEYGNTTCCVEVVDSCADAIDHINRYVLHIRHTNG